MSLFSGIWRRIEELPGEITGDARRELKEALDTARRAEQTVVQRAVELEPAIKEALTAVPEADKAEALKALSQFVSYVSGVLGG
jgi:hypothetical protein